MRVAAFALFREPETKGRVMVEVTNRVHVIVRVLCSDVEDLELATANDVDDTHFSVEQSRL